LQSTQPSEIVRRLIIVTHKLGDYNCGCCYGWPSCSRSHSSGTHHNTWLLVFENRKALSCTVHNNLILLNDEVLLPTLPLVAPMAGGLGGYGYGPVLRHYHSGIGPA